MRKLLRHLAPLALLALAGVTASWSEVRAPAVSAQPAATGAIAGKVTRSKDGGPIAGAAVTARPSQGGALRSTKTASDGSYKIGGLRDGFWDVTATATGMIQAGAWRLDVKAGGLTTGDLALVAGGTVTGTVVGEDGKPIAGALLPWNKSRTDAQGRYSLYPVPPSSDWTVTAQAPGHVSTDSAPIEVKAEQTTEVPPLVLETAGQITGRIVDARSQKPIAGASIYAYGDGIEKGSWGSDKTDAAGRFRIDGLRAGAHSLNVDCEGYEGQNGGGATVSKGQEVAIAPLTLALRDPMLHVYANQKVFLATQKPRLYFNAFRTPSFQVEIFAIDPLPALQAAGSLEKLAETSVAGKQPVRTLPSQSVAYKRALQEVNGKTLVLDPLPAGTYLVRGTAAKGLSSATWIQITDLAVVAKETGREILVFASDLATSKLRAGVKIVGYPGGKDLGTTDASGIARIDKTAAALGTTFTLVAEDPAHAASRAMLYATGRYEPEAAPAWRVYFETDRPIYRPGQTVYYKGTVRADDLGTYRLRLPAHAHIAVSDSADAHLLDTDLAIGPSGAFDGEIALPAKAALGSYSATITLGAVAGKDDPLEVEGGDFRVEEYRKPEFKVAVEVDPPSVIGDAPLTATIDASYYFGGPVGGAQISYDVYATPYWSGPLFADDTPCPGCWNGWDDSEISDRGYGGLVLHGTAVTDGNGRVVLPIPTRRPTGDSDLRYRVTARVADPTGRQAEDSAQALVTRAAFALDVSSDSYVVKPEEETVLTVRAAGFDGKPVATPFSLRLYEERWEKGKSTTLDVSETSGATGADGKAVLRITPHRAGYLKFYAMARDAAGNGTDATQYVWSAGEHWLLKEYPFQDLKIVTDKRTYRPGDTARVLVNSATPDADVLFTIEGDAVREARVLHLQGASQLIELPITSDHLPTLHLGATLVAKATFAEAEQAVPVSPEEKILTVKVTPERPTYHPGDKAVFTVETRDAAGHGVPAEVSVAVVDEAIFALSRELVPDVRQAFYGPRPNRVTTAYSFPMVYEGGVDKFGPTERRHTFKDTALWSPRVATGADGTARVEVDLPDNLTTWRATARAVTPDTRVGEGRGKTIARKELMVRFATPRFLITGDTARLIAALHNETATAMPVAVRATGTGVELLAAASASVDVPAHGVATWDVPVRVLDADTAKLSLDAAGGGYKDGVELDLPVYPYGGLASSAAAGSTDGTAKATLTLPAGADPRGSRLTVRLAPSLAAGLYDALDALDTYPYGCIEQTLDGFVPAAVVRQAFDGLGLAALANAAGGTVKSGDPLAARPAGGQLLESYTWLQKHLPENVQKGLDRLRALQHEDGGWGWWDHDPSHPFLTAYAVYGLALARETGQHVDEVVLTKGREALVRMLGTATDADQRAWILYALVRSGDLGEAEHKALTTLDDDTAGGLSAYGRALVTSALVPGEPERAQASAHKLLGLALHDATGAWHWPIAAGARYTWVGSEVEATSYSALSLLEALPAGSERDAAVEGAIRYLVQSRRGAWWVNTKDTAAAILATTAWLREHPSELAPDYRVRTSLNGTLLAEQVVGKQAVHDFMSRLVADRKQIVAGQNVVEVNKDKDKTKLAKGEAKPRVYYAALLEGVVPSAAAQPENAGFTVERTYLHVGLRAKTDGTWERFTEPYDPAAAALHPGDRLEVHVKVKADRDWSFVMVEDPLPSGFEVEDAFGRENSEYADDGWGWWFARREVRDEKVAFFATSWPLGDDGSRTQEFVYTIRAEVPGEKHVLPANASLMYFPEVRGASAGTVLRVE